MSTKDEIMEQRELLLDDLHDELRSVREAAAALVEAVEKYTVQVPGDYMTRTELLNTKDNLKKLLNNGK